MLCDKIIDLEIKNIYIVRLQIIAHLMLISSEMYMLIYHSRYIGKFINNLHLTCPHILFVMYIHKIHTDIL